MAKKEKPDQETVLAANICHCGTVKDCIADAMAVVEMMQSKDKCLIYDLAVAHMVIQTLCNLSAMDDVRRGMSKEAAKRQTEELVQMTSDATSEALVIAAEYMKQQLRLVMLGSDAKKAGVTVQ